MLDANGFITTKTNRIIDRTSLNLQRDSKDIEFMTFDELRSLPSGSVMIYDVECYINFFYVAFKSLHNGKFFAFELSPDSTFHPVALRNVLWNHCIVGFNSKNYDIPMIELALKGVSNAQLKEASDFIIKGDASNNFQKVTIYAFEKKYKLQIPNYNHIDLIEVAPLEASLKLYGARLHTKRLQDLPIEPIDVLTQSDAELLRPYCCTDLELTEELFNELAAEIKIRCEMSETYGVDLRSKSDAQIAETVIVSELTKILGYKPKRPQLDSNLVLQYDTPDFLCFQTDQLKEMFEIVKNAKFYLDGAGSPIMPKELANLKVKIGNSIYQLGMGGLHSTEKSIAHVAGSDELLEDNDVESYYPKTILNQRLAPSHLGEAFLEVYETIVKTRLAAKKEGNKKVANMLKIVINGSFGKLGNKYSALYAPQLMLQVTITGQLALLMLIEAVELAGISVVSGNTDGFISKFPKADHEKLHKIIDMWEAHTGYKTEANKYKAVYSRDVNNYIAITEKFDEKARFLDDKLGCKTKGTYAERGSALNSVLSKNPETLVCTDAVLQYLVNGTPVEKTIKECTDFKRFVSVKRVKGGGEKNGVYLGKVVRWYYAKNEAGFIAYVGSGNKVGKSDGAKPVMDMPTILPSDIDYDFYVKESLEMLYDCGALTKVKTTAIEFF